MSPSDKLYALGVMLGGLGIVTALVHWEEIAEHSFPQMQAARPARPRRELLRSYLETSEGDWSRPRRRKRRRRGRCDVAKLMAEHGDAKLTDLLVTLADCPGALGQHPRPMHSEVSFRA